MSTEQAPIDAGGQPGAVSPETIGEGMADTHQAWEQIANGRYMPRRIRGSCPGRELG
jgi:hypothetical protein